MSSILPFTLDEIDQINEINEIISCLCTNVPLDKNLIILWTSPKSTGDPMTAFAHKGTEATLGSPRT